MTNRTYAIAAVLLLLNSIPVLAGEADVHEEPVVIDPKGEVKSVVIWLHGLGADGHDFEPVIDELGLPENHGIRFVFPHAPMRPITINGGFVMRGWYDITSEEITSEEDEQGIRESADRLSRLVKAEIQEHSLDSGRVVLAGFSQGGAIVLHTALRYPEPLAGVMALSTYVPLLDSLEKERHEANRHIRIFMAHGNYDRVIPLRHAQLSRDKLQMLGYEIEWHSYFMEHAVIPDEIDDIGLWLKKQLVD